MIHLLPKLKRAFPFLGQRSVTETDLFGFCADRGVEVVFNRDISSGVWVRFKGSDFIFLNNKLHGWRLLYVFAHEVAHCLFHAPSQSSTSVEFFDHHAKAKNHHEAESVAAMLLLPIPEMENALMSGAYKKSSEIAELIALRLDLYSQIKE